VPGQFLLKDAVLLAGALVLLGEALQRLARTGAADPLART
jgi:uncharacterized membrane protein YkgB